MGIQARTNRVTRVTWEVCEMQTEDDRQQDVSEGYSEAQSRRSRESKGAVTMSTQAEERWANYIIRLGGQVIAMENVEGLPRGSLRIEKTFGIGAKQFESVSLSCPRRHKNPDSIAEFQDQPTDQRARRTRLSFIDVARTPVDSPVVIVVKTNEDARPPCPRSWAVRQDTFSQRIITGYRITTATPTPTGIDV
ncbi:hypothetical protein PILCRDRAFT_87789 [Piloderma croceum F 1598]|uniref:Uncharacterized protein n=1 Tax=Piloderma croceum (strain F 1598) TaxID=765440 RepID=A0A0C3BBW0_PILCF|nr:hypothetical protein PILCRDRAFT_87789 [Piloderma croceum F 1598]